MAFLFEIHLVVLRTTSTPKYRVTLVVEYLGWVDLRYIGGVAGCFFCYPLPKQSGGTYQILVNPMKVFDHPVALDKVSTFSNSGSMDDESAYAKSVRDMSRVLEYYVR